MTEQEYLSRLERALKDAPEDDRNEALAFYHGYFEDGGIPTDSPEEAADRLLHDGKPTVPGKKKTTFGWKLTVIILTFPFWIGILAAWFALLVTAWVVLAVFPIALAAGSIGSLIGGILYLLSHRITGNWLGTRWRWFNHALLETLPTCYHWTLERTQIIVAEILPLDEEGGCL